MNNRFDFQTKELSRQIIEIADLRGNIEDYSEDRIQQLSERLNSLKNRQMYLDSKADRIIQRIMNKGDPIVSEFEKQYYDSLEVIAKAIKGEDGLKNKMIMVLFLKFICILIKNIYLRYIYISFFFRFTLIASESAQIFTRRL